MGRITRKGQVTIPKRLRNRFGLRPGMTVELVVEDSRVVLRAAGIDDALDRWAGALELDDVDGFIDDLRDEP